MVTIKSERQTDMLARARRTPWPCMRCLAQYAAGNFNLNGKFGCSFPEVSEANDNEDIWSGLCVPNGNGTDTQFMRCNYCLDAGQDCYSVSDWHQLTQIGLN
jgi:hypothetical protein